MALNLNLKSLEGLPGKCERYVKATFRGSSQTSAQTKAKEIAYFGQHLSWPVGRKLDPSDTLFLKAYNNNKYRGKRLLGTLTISLEQLITEGQIAVRENLVDSNNSIVRTLINFEVIYTFPDSALGGLREETFDYPLYDLETTLHGKKKIFKLPSEKGSDFEDEVDDEMDYNDERGLGKLGDEETDSSLLTKASYGVSALVQPLVMKPLNYQLQVKIIEAKQLMGSNINPRVEVAIGDRVHYTDLKMSSNNPFYNQIFVEDFFVTPAEMNDIVIRLRVHHIDSKIIKRIFPAKVIGEFSIDVRTIMEQEDHSFQDKWAFLIDPKEAMDTKGRGYIKCDLIVHAPGQRVKVHQKKILGDQEENIEANLLLPRSLGATRNRQLAEISVKIHRAEDLPCMNNDLMASVKRAVGGNLKSMVDPLVEVSYAGLTGKTKYKSSTYTPEWNQEVSFLEMFPPYCRRIRLSLCDWNLIRDDVIATHYIELDKIWKIGKEGREDILPTFGPSWVNFYGTPRQYGFQQTVNPTDVLDKSLGQGAAYRGRVLMAIKTSMYFDPDSAKTGVKTYPVNQASQFVCGKKEGYVLYGTLFQATVIDPEIAKDRQPFLFEMSIGLYGNTLDKISSNDMALEEKQAGTGPSGKSGAANKDVKDKEATANWYNPTTPVCICKSVMLNGVEYFHVPFANKKPNLFVRCFFEDQRFRMGVPNILDKLRSFFEKHLDIMEYILSRRKRNVVRKFRNFVERKLIFQLDTAISTVRSCRGSAPKTLLDKERQRIIRTDLEKAKQKVLEMAKIATRSGIKNIIKECRGICYHLEELAEDPQHGLPDVFIWLIKGDKRIAYARVRSRDILYTASEEERGVRAGKMNTLYLRKPGSQVKGADGWKIQAQLQMYLWLGLTKDIKSYRKHLPEGYSDTKTKGGPPSETVYVYNSHFRLRCYIFMGRNVPGSDDTGLSDPFLRILLNEYVLTSSVKFETLSPLWDETLVLDNVVFCHDANYLKQQPPPILVEVYDYDSSMDSEYLGRAICHPVVFVSGEVYKAPKLQTTKFYRGDEQAGELIACFELVETSQEGQIMAQEVRSIADMSVMSIEEDQEIDLDRDTRIYRVPRGIRPVRATFRLEAILWGVRDLRPILFMAVTRPKICLEICGYRLQTNVIKNCKKNPNFKEPLMQKRLRLPNDIHFWPPISLICLEVRRFGPTAFVGQHILTRTFDFYAGVPKRDEQEEDLESEEEQEVDESAPIANETVAPNVVSLTEPPVGEATVAKSEPAVVATTKPLDVPGAPVKVQVPRKPTKEELEEVDWWSRYYATLDSISSELNYDIIRRESSSEAESDILEDIVLELESEDDGEEIALILEREKKKKRKSRRKKKKKKKRRIPLIMKSEKDLFEKEEEDDIVFETASIKEDKSWIEKIKFYPCPLEKVKDFDGFLTPLRTYELIAGKREDQENEDRTKVVGKLKANFLIYRIDEDELDLAGEDSIGSASISSEEDDNDENEDSENESKAKESKAERDKRKALIGRQKKEVDIKELRLFPTLPRSSDTFEMLVRVYVVEGRDLHPSDPNGLSDPFLVVQLGPEQIINDKDNYKPNTLNPVFGSLFEFECIFPQESLLTVQVFDKDSIGTSDLIGETRIDLESRFLSKHRAHCGIPATFHNHGYLKWRDQKPPTSILETQCRLAGIPLPKYMPIFNKVTVDGVDFFGETEIEDESGEVKASCEQLALEVLNNWDKLPNGGGYKLVPEHIETRPLYADEKQELQQGSLLMWVDIFNRQLGTLQAPVDIAPRQPIKYVLRVIIHKADDVVLNDTSMFTDEKSSDIYIKGWMKGVGVDDQSTDVHYRSVTGEGLFNWRFVFPFEYLKAEDKLTYPMKSTLSLDARDVKVPCKLYMQVWDAGLISADCFLGGMEWYLSRIPRGAKSKKSCGLHQYAKNVPTFSLFRNKRCRCWWPFFIEDEDGDKECTGKVDAELNLLPAEEDEMNPAGRGREEPQALPAPNRPDSSFLNFFGPLKMIYHFLCRKFFWLLIKLLIIAAIALIFVLFVYNVPGYLSKKLLGA